MGQGLGLPDRGSGSMPVVVPIPRGTACLAHSHPSIRRKSTRVICLSQKVRGYLGSIVFSGQTIPHGVIWQPGSKTRRDISTLRSYWHSESIYVSMVQVQAQLTAHPGWFAGILLHVYHLFQSEVYPNSHRKFMWVQDAEHKCLGAGFAGHCSEVLWFHSSFWEWESSLALGSSGLKTPQGSPFFQGCHG